MEEHFEAIGHAKAFCELLELAKKNTITEDDIKKLHQLFRIQIDSENVGKYRTKQVIITDSDVEFPKPTELGTKMKEFVYSLPQMKKDLHPVEFAAMVHVVFVNIHPFIYGNGRVARLWMNLALLQSGYNITIIPPAVRADYIRVLQDSNRNIYEAFVDFISEMVIELQKEYLRIIERLN